MADPFANVIRSVSSVCPIFAPFTTTLSTVNAVNAPVPGVVAPMFIPSIAWLVLNKAVKSVTAAVDPAPSAKIIAPLPADILTLPPEPCVNVAVWLVPFLTKYSLSALLGLMVIVFVPDGDPANTRTLNIPSDKLPSLVVSVCVVPDNVIVPTPFINLSIMSRFVLVVVPQVPACSPKPIFSIPPLLVNVLGIYTSKKLYVTLHYGNISVHV